MQMMISGIPVTVNRKKIKNMYIRVKRPHGEVVVSAPETMRKKTIVYFVQERVEWIRDMQEQMLKYSYPEERQYVSGESVILWGKKYTLQVEQGGKRNAVVLSDDRVILTMRKESTPQQREKCLKEWQRSLLKMEIERILPVWEERTGLYCSDWQTKDMKSRWGTCNTETKKIWINLQLAQKSPECLEYVILHELAHLKERNHGPKFKAILDHYMPEWREVRKRLNNQ